MAEAEPDQVIGLCRQLVDRPVEDLPRGEFWDLAFHPRTLSEICAVRQGLLGAESDRAAAALLRAVMLGALHGPRGKHTQSYLSNQMPRSYATKPTGAVRYWKKHDLRPEYASVVELVSRRAVRALADAPRGTAGAIFDEDARRLQLEETPYGPFSHVVTSPPYFGMRSYVTDQWLRSWFLGGPEEPDYRANRQMDTSSPCAFSRDLAESGREWPLMPFPGVAW
jgi:hypothetical protein